MSYHTPYTAFQLTSTSPTLYSPGKPALNDCGGSNSTLGKRKRAVGTTLGAQEAGEATQPHGHDAGGAGGGEGHPAHRQRPLHEAAARDTLAFGGSGGLARGGRRGDPGTDRVGLAVGEGAGGGSRLGHEGGHRRRADGARLRPTRGSRLGARVLLVSHEDLA